MRKNYTMEMLLQLAADYSTDRKTKVAAGVYIKGRLIWGVNHLEQALPEEEIENRTELYYATMIHAEIDMLSKTDCQNALQGKEVYVTLFPCDNCAKALVAAGIKHIIVHEDRPDVDYNIRAKEILSKSKVTWEII